MCDYSLHNVASREAKVGDRLRSTTFANSMTRGFCAVSEPDMAVCLRPGTEISFDQDVSYWKSFSFFPLRMFGYETIPQRVARFRKIDLGRLASHHDALEFPDGRTVLVTNLKPGLKVTVHADKSRRGERYLIVIVRTYRRTMNCWLRLENQNLPLGLAGMGQIIEIQSMRTEKIKLQLLNYEREQCPVVWIQVQVRMPLFV
jgi:hypothetical protein